MSLWKTLRKRKADKPDPSGRDWEDHPEKREGAQDVEFDAADSNEGGA